MSQKTQGHVVTVSELMSAPVITTSAKALLGEVRAKMQSANVRHLAVTDERQHVIGVLSQRDVALATELEVAAAARRALVAGDVMRRNVYTVSVEAPAHEAAARMHEHKIGCLPVIDGNGRAIGMITATDLLAVAQRALLALPLVPVS